MSVENAYRERGSEAEQKEEREKGICVWWLDEGDRERKREIRTTISKERASRRRRSGKKERRREREKLHYIMSIFLIMGK